MTDLSFKVEKVVPSLNNMEGVNSEICHSNSEKVQCAIKMLATPNHHVAVEKQQNGRLAIPG